MTVLIVDDDEILGRSLARVLRRLRHTCRVERSVDAALRALAVDRPGLLLTDFDLGECCTGADLACWSLNAFHVPAVIMTGHDMQRVRAELANVGLPELTVLAKPFALEQVVSHLSTFDAPVPPIARSPA